MGEHISAISDIRVGWRSPLAESAVPGNPSRQRFANRFLFAAFVSAAIAVAVIGWRANQNARAADNWSGWVAHTQTVLETLRQSQRYVFFAFRAADELEKATGVGRISPGNQLTENLIEVGKRTAKLRRLTADNVSQQRRLAMIDLVEQQAATIARELNAVGSVNEAEGGAKVAEFAQLHAALYQLGDRFFAMSLAEQGLLAERNQRARAGFRQSLLVIAIGGIFIFVWLLIGAFAALTAASLRQAALSYQIEQRSKAESKFRALLESAPDAIVIYGGDGRIVLVNAQSEKLFGYERVELLGQTVEMLLPERLRERYRRQRTSYSVPAVPTIAKDLNLYGMRKDGGEFPIEVSLSPIETEEGSLISSAVRDITERSRVEEELRALNASEARHSAQLETANKEIEAFSYSVSHDLRSPLRAIDGYGIILLEEHSALLDTEARSLLQRIRAATQRMAQLIDDLLDLAHVTHGEIAHDLVDLSAMAIEILRDLHSAEPAREVECVVQGGVQATGDQRLLQVMMQNLLENAWKFTMKTANPKIEFSTVDRDGEKIYVVRDNGSGFDMAYASKLFGTFQRMHTSPDFPGSGVGLAIVQRIVRRHGGRIWAEAAIDKGATFSFALRGAAPDV